MQFTLHAVRLDEVPVPAIYFHELDTGEMWLAERAGEAVGFAGLITRSGIGFLSEFFVDPRYQSAGIGRSLLARALSSGARRYCTLSSTDPRALALYARAGLYPQWPHFLLTGVADRLDPIDASGARIQAARPDDPSIVEWDARIGGRRRPEDHGFWRSDLGALPIWVERGARSVGYGYVRPRRPRAGSRPAS